MTVKTIRFNEKEENILKKVLSHYGRNFSGCVKELLNEKLEDLKDIDFIKHIKEKSRKNYYTANQITSLFNKK